MSGLEGDHASVQVQAEPAAAGLAPQAGEAGVQAFAALGNHTLAGLESPAAQRGGARAAAAGVTEAPGDALIARSLARAVLARQEEPNSSQMPPEGEGEMTAFQPVVSAALGAVRLGDTVNVGLMVDNAASAPEGTTYDWTWGEMDADLEEVLSTATGDSAELQLKALAVGSFSATPELGYTEPECRSTMATVPPVAIEVGDITVTWDEIEITAGQRKPDEHRGVSSVYVGDTLTIRVHVGEVEGPEDIGVEATLGSVGTAKPKGAWSDTTYEWTWVQENSGDFDFDATVVAPGGTEDIELYGITVFTDLVQWSLACQAAEKALGKLYDDAILRLDSASTHVDGAIETFNKTMEGKAKVDKNREKQTDLLIQALLIPVGGMGSGVIKTAMAGGKGAAAEGLTTTATDAFKFAVKTYGTMAGMGIASKVAPTAPQGATAFQGDLSKRMKALSLQLRGEKNSVTGNLGGLYAVANAAAIKQPDADVSLDDPNVTIPPNDQLLLDAAAMPDKTEQEHLKVLWHDWLPAAGDYIAFTYVNYSHEDGEWVWQIEDFVWAGASQCGENVMDWATTYHLPGDDLLRRLAWKAAKGEKDEPPPKPRAPDGGGGGEGGAGGAGGAPAGAAR